MVPRYKALLYRPSSSLLLLLFFHSLLGSVFHSLKTGSKRTDWSEFIEGTSSESLSTHSVSSVHSSKPLVFWSADAHPAPVADIRGFVEPLGVTILEHSLSDYCRYFNSCRGSETLKVLTRKNYLQADADHIRSEFYDVYKNDSVMQSVDAFLCTDVVSTCQLYFRFNKPVIIVVTNRYYVARINQTRSSMRRWRKWNDDLRRLAADSRNVIAANNLYDIHFMRFFTNIQAIYIPTYAEYTHVSYNPTKTIFAFAKSRVWIIQGWLMTVLRTSINKIGACNTSVTFLNRSKQYTYSELTSYRGLIHIPYQVSTISVFEQYRMNIPLFFPSKRLLIEWELEHWLLRERIQPWYERHPISPPCDWSQRHLPNPNESHNASALDYWLQFADYYTMPHIQYFDSVEHLAEILCHVTLSDLRTISRSMQQYNAELKKRLTAQWEKVTMKIAKGKEENS